MDFNPRVIRRASSGGGVMIAVGGLATFKSDVGGFVANVAEAVVDNPLGTGLVVVGAIVISVANWRAIKVAAGGIEEPAPVIRGWLRERGWTLTEPPASEHDFEIHATPLPMPKPPNAPDDWETPEPRRMTFLQTKGSSMVLLLGGIRPSPEHRAALNKLSESFQTDLWDELKLILLGRGSGGSMADDSLESIQVSNSVLWNKDVGVVDFLAVVGDLQRAVETINTVIVRAARHATEADEANDG